MGVSQYRAAKTIGLPPPRINEIVHGTRRITPETGIRISKALGMSEQFWVGLRIDFDIEVEKDKHRAEIEALRPLESA